MRIFDESRGWSERINFVDENNVLVGFDYNQNCCESFGYFLSVDEPTKVENNDLSIDVEGFNFDPNFHKVIVLDDDGYNDTTLAVFKLTKNNQTIYLTLHNSHNGYYSHGFNMDIGEKQVLTGSL